MAPVAVMVSFFLLLLTWLSMSGLNLNSARYDRGLRALDDFSQFERGLSREVLTARAGLSLNYDALARMTDAYDDSLNRLREAAGSGSEEGAAIEALAARARRQQDLIERFKSRNALLRNSFAYFGIFSARLAASDHMPLVAVATTLTAAMLHLTLDTSPAAAREVKDTAREATDAAVGYAKDAYENSGDTFREGSQAVAKKVQENPLGALLVAAGIGFALALLMTRPPRRPRGRYYS